jgi:hypothetical protein
MCLLRCVCVSVYARLRICAFVSLYVGVSVCHHFLHTDGKRSGGAQEEKEALAELKSVSKP